MKEAKGVMSVAAVRPDSTAAQIGLEAGDVILRVNNQPVPDGDTFREALLTARRGRSVLMLVRRGRYGYHITLPFDGQRI